MAVINFSLNTTNNQQKLCKPLVLRGNSVGSPGPTEANKPTLKTLLALLVPCWLPLANTSKPIDRHFQVPLLAVGSFLALNNNWSHYVS